MDSNGARPRGRVLSTLCIYILTTARSYATERFSSSLLRGVSGDDPDGGAGSGVPRRRRETASREVRDPVRQAFVAWRRHIAGGSGVPLPATAAWVPDRKSPRWSAERGPGRTGTGPRLASAGVAPRKRDRTKECACRRSTRPSSGAGPAAVATAMGSSPPQRQSSRRRCGDKRRDKETREGNDPHADLRRGNEECCAAHAAKRAV